MWRLWQCLLPFINDELLVVYHINSIGQRTMCRDYFVVVVAIFVMQFNIKRYIEAQRVGINVPTHNINLFDERRPRLPGHYAVVGFVRIVC